MKKITVFWTSFVILVAANCAFAGLSLTPVDSPSIDGSWSQKFNLGGSTYPTSSFNSIAVQMTSAGASFESPALSSFSVSGWVLGSQTSVAANASGGSVDNLLFKVRFAGDMDEPLAFDLSAFNNLSMMARFHVEWVPFDPIDMGGGSPGTWNVTAVPLPASVLLGVFAVGLAGRKLRKTV